MRMYLTNETIGSTHAMRIGLVHEVIDEVPRTQQRATDVALLLAQKPQDAAALVHARDLLDRERMAAEAIGHASCLEANGGRYANSELLGPNDELPTAFVPRVAIVVELVVARCLGFWNMDVHVS